MEIIEKKILRTDEMILLVSNDSLKKFNIAYLPLDIVDISEEGINFKKAKFIFPYMVNKNKARKEYVIHST